MAVFRRPVSTRRNIKSRKASTQKRTFTPPTYRRRSVGNIQPNSGNNNETMVIHRGIGMPDRFRTKLRFTESFILSSFGTSITQFYGVRMNGAYDPVLAVGGGQPTWWDQFAANYARYNVIGAKCTATFALPLSTTAGDGPYHVGILGTRGSSLPTSDSPTLSTTPNCVSDLVVHDQTKVLSMTYTPKQLTVLGDDGDVNTQSLITSTPADAYNALIWASPQGPSTTGSVNVVFVIEYLIDFYNLNPTVDL